MHQPVEVAMRPRGFDDVLVLGDSSQFIARTNFQKATQEEVWAL